MGSAHFALLFLFGDGHGGGAFFFLVAALASGSTAQFALLFVSGLLRHGRGFVARFAGLGA